MGTVAEIWGVGPSFLVMGGVLMVLLAAIVILLERRTRTPRPPRT
jgi:hypothetical protein